MITAEECCVCAKDIKRRIHEPDSAWAWFICLVGLASSIVITGFVFSFGVLNPVFLQEFHEGNARTAWVGSLCMSCASFFEPLVAKLCDRFGTREVSISGALMCVASLLVSSQVSRLWMLYITYSCFFGVGASCVQTAIFLAVSASFLKRRSLATGTLVVAHAAGIMIVNPVLQVLLEQFGWRKSFLAWSSVTSSICVFGCLFHSNVQREIQNGESTKYDRKESQSQTFSIWRHPPFVVYTLSTAVLYLGLHIPQLYMASYCKDLGISGDKAATLYLGFGLSSVITRLLVGKLCDSKTFHAQYIFQAAGLVMGAATLLCPISSNSYILLMVYFVIFGLAEGSAATSINSLILTCVPDQARSKSFGFWLFFLSLTMAIGPPFAGFIADELGSYIPAFYMAGSLIISSSLIVFILRCFQDELLSVTSETEELLVAEKITVL